MIERANEFGTSTTMPLMEGGDSQVHLSAGQILREAREAHSLHCSVVAAALKVPVQKLEALEADDFETLSDPVFTRAFAASVCRVLRIDPAPVLAKLPEIPRAANVVNPNARPAKTVRFDPYGREGGGRLLSRRLLIVVAVLLAAAAALVWLPQSVFDKIRAGVTQLVSHGAQKNHGQPTVSNVTTETSTNSSAIISTETALESVPVAPIVAPASAVPTPASPTVADPGSVADTSPLVITAHPGTSPWIEVLDATKKVMFKRRLQSAESVTLSGELPLRVNVGSARSVDVQVHGQPMDLTPLVRSNGTARFEVKKP